MLQYAIIALEPGIHWPRQEVRARFRGYELLLRPETEEDAPSVVLAYESLSSTDAHYLIRQFLSSLAWAHGAAFREAFAIGGGVPVRVGKKGRTPAPAPSPFQPEFRLDYLPEPDDPRARLALALYREALGLNSNAFVFLGLYKVINLLHPGGNEQKAWINAMIERLEDHAAKERLAKLKTETTDVGDYLYVSGRCAVAHAFSEPIVDPDDPRDTMRLAMDLPLMKALAEHAIENEMGVLSEMTVWRQHLYELEGFRTLLGREVVARLKSGETLPADSFPALPRLALRLRGHEPFPAFECLASTVVDASEGSVLVRCGSGDKLVTVLLALNFREERLEFDPEHDVTIVDNATSAPLRYSIDHLELMKGLVGNGELEVWNSDCSTLLGRTDPYLPVNIDFGATVRNLETGIRTLRDEEKRRAAKDATRVPGS